MQMRQRQLAPFLLSALLAASSSYSFAQVPSASQGEVAFAAPANNALQNETVACASPCYVVGDRWPYKTCQAECNPEVCNRGYGVYLSQEICCSPGVAFPDGCSTRPSECWVVENFAVRTCVRDDRKCLQGYGVYPSEAACCAPSAAFPTGCANVTKAAEPCWVVDTYWPARQCRQSRTLCSPEAGVQNFPSKEACCAPNAAFGEGCSVYVPVTPCWLAAEPQYPNRTCRQSNDVALCNRGWGVFQSAEVCCAPGAAFSDGCNTPAVAAAIAPAAAAATPVAATPVAAVPAAVTPVNATATPVPAAAVPAATPLPAAVPPPAAVTTPVVPAPANQTLVAVTTPPLPENTSQLIVGK